MVSVGHLTCHGMKGIGQKPDESVPDAIKPRPGDVMCDSGAGLWLFQTVRGSSVLCVLQSFSDLGLNLIAEFQIVSEKILHCFTSLGELAFAVAEP